MFEFRYNNSPTEMMRSIPMVRRIFSFDFAMQFFEFWDLYGFRSFVLVLEWDLWLSKVKFVVT